MNGGAPAVSWSLRLLGTRLLKTLGILVLLSLFSLFSWRSVLAAGISNHTTNYQQGDVGQGILFLEWLPVALGHGLNPFFSRMMFAPKGVNMLSNTSFFLTALVMSPVTVLFGPVAAFDVAVVLSPVVSGYAVYWVLRRYDVTAPASLVAALLYGYSPYLMHEDPLGHFNLAWMFFPPLLLYFLDEICVRQKWSWWTGGLALAGLVVVQYFNSPEMLIVTAVVAVAVLVVLAVSHPRTTWKRARHAAAAAAVAIAASGAVLAYPVWFAVAGPEHVTTFNTTVSTIDNAVNSAVWPSAITVFGQKPPYHGIDSGFVGPVVVALVLASAFFWRRNRLVVPCLVGAVVSYVLSWGPYLRVSGSGYTDVRGPDYWLLQIPLLRNMQEYRMSDITDLCVAVLCAVVIDRFFVWVGTRRVLQSGLVEAALTVVAAAAVLVFPLFGLDLHEAAYRVVVPAAFSRGPVRRAPFGTVTVQSPPDFIDEGEPLVWQAVEGLRYDVTDGYAWRQVDAGGLGSTLGANTPVTDFFGAGRLGEGVLIPRRVPASQLTQLRETFIAWRVGDVVFQSGHPDTPARGIAMMRALTGEAPQRIGGAAVWTDVCERLRSHPIHYSTLVFPAIYPRSSGAG